MKKPLILSIIILFANQSVAQTTYICMIHGKPAYTTVKQNAQCQISKINGISESERAVFSPPIEVASAVALPSEQAEMIAQQLDSNDPIAKIWYEYEYGSYDRTPILPPPPPRVVTVTAESETRSHPISGSPKSGATRKVAVSQAHHALIYQPINAPVLSRREVLSQEIEREQTALKIAQSQLTTAQKRNDTANIIKLNNVVRDRLANVQALQRELSR